MKNLKEMISTKDAAYLSDIFNWNMVTAEKFDHYLEMVENENIAKKLNELVSMHLAFAEKTIELLESGVKND